MSAWRVGSKTKVTLFKGDEIFGILLDEEKAAVVVRWLNWAAVMEEPWDDLPDEAVVELYESALAQMILRGKEWRRGVEAPRGAPEGGAEGDPAAARAASVRGGVCAMGERCGGDCPSWCDGGEGE